MLFVEFQTQTHFFDTIFLTKFTPLGSLPAGTKVEAGADGRVTLGGAKLPQGAAVVANPDGSKSISGKVPETSFQQSGCQERRCICESRVMMIDLFHPLGNLAVGAKVERNPDGTYSVDGSPMPPSVTVIKNSDGTLSLVSTSGSDPLAKTKLPKNAVTNADGSTSIAAGSIIKENSDGTLTVDGVLLPPGIAVKKLPDGSSVLFQSPLASTKLPASAKVNSDGTATIASGANVKENADGTVVIDGIVLPKGTGVKKMPDGSMVTFEKPKLKKVPGKAPTPKINTDGSVSLGNVKLPAGSSPGNDGSISLPKGTLVTRSADGAVLVDGKPLPAGIGAKINPDGSVSLASTATLPPAPKVQTGSDGSLAVGSVKLPQGSEANVDGSISLPVGSKVSKNKDGSVTIDGQRLPAGTTVKTNPDGTMSLVSSLPSPTTVTTNLDGSIKLGEASLPKGAKPSLDGSVTLEKGTVVARTANGRLTLEGQELPLGTEVRTNPDGSLSILPPPSITGLVSCHHDGDLLSDGLVTSNHQKAPNSLSKTFCEPNTNNNHEESPSAEKDADVYGPRLFSSGNLAQTATALSSSDVSHACHSNDRPPPPLGNPYQPVLEQDSIDPSQKRVSGRASPSSSTSSSGNAIPSGASPNHTMPLDGAELSNKSKIESVHDKQAHPQETKTNFLKSNTKQFSSVREDFKATPCERGSTIEKKELIFFRSNLLLINQY